ncbi:hypothetical protein [Okeania sp. SIO2C2]|uniref:hypothetical protein n=1 Tax=Okeania sp. SIO2C2 TaxID=2607787 RepID=UPI00257CAD58|nr:hypothetical protein [Okeania sp. SIO2C2]
MINTKFFYLGVRRQESRGKREKGKGKREEGRGKMWAEIIQKIQLLADDFSSKLMREKT